MYSFRLTSPLFPLFPSSGSSFHLDAKSRGLLVFCFYLSRASYESPWRLALAVVLGQGHDGRGGGGVGVKRKEQEGGRAAGQ